MEKTASSQATNWREGRRFRAWELHQKGWKQQAIAEALGVTQGAVSQWLKRVKEGGVEGLRHRPPPGAAPRLSSEQREQLLELLAHIRRWKEERWPEVKKGCRRRAEGGLCGPVRFLSAAQEGAHVCSSRSNPGLAGSLEPRPPVGHGRHYPGRQAVPDGAGKSLLWSRRG